MVDRSTSKSHNSLAYQGLLKLFFFELHQYSCGRNSESYSHKSMELKVLGPECQCTRLHSMRCISVNAQLLQISSFRTRKRSTHLDHPHLHVPLRPTRPNRVTRGVTARPGMWCIIHSNQVHSEIADFSASLGKPWANSVFAGPRNC